MYVRQVQSLHRSTFGANPLSAATARAVHAEVPPGDALARQRQAQSMAQRCVGDVMAVSEAVTEFCADTVEYGAAAVREAPADRSVAARPPS